MQKVFTWISSLFLTPMRTITSSPAAMALPEHCTVYRLRTEVRKYETEHGRVKRGLTQTRNTKNYGPKNRRKVTVLPVCCRGGYRMYTALPEVI